MGKGWPDGDLFVVAVPGMRQNAPKRNLIVFLVYLILLGMAFSAVNSAAPFEPAVVTAPVS